MEVGALGEAKRRFEHHLEEAAEFFRSGLAFFDDVLIVHHNDVDGLCGAAILKTALEGQGVIVNTLCAEKPYPALVQYVHEQSRGIVIYVDFGGRSARGIAQANRGRTLILDHHAPEEVYDDSVFNCNPMFCGLRGDRHASGSVVAYAFACKLDPRNSDMAHLAAAGAIGDEQDYDGRLEGLNRLAWETARDVGQIQPSHDGLHRNAVMLGYRHRTLASFGDDVTTLGGVGYLEHGPDLGLELCVSGYTDELEAEILRLRQFREKAFNEAEDWLKSEGLVYGAHIQWFDLKSRFEPMGVKMVGELCNAIRDRPWVDPSKYIAGFQFVPDEIPGIGPMGMGITKVSMRLPSDLMSRMFLGKTPSLLDILPPATAELKGFVDGCHTYSAATTVGRGLESELVRRMDLILSRSLTGGEA